MRINDFVSSDEIRSRFSQAMSEMYKLEVPQYGMLLDLVADLNASVLHAEPALRQSLDHAGELNRLDVERHGAIRLGTAQELHTMRRIFAVMGMAPVGYYDLSVAGVPVHATAFRPTTDEALQANPFRVFTSLLRLDLIHDESVRETAADILQKRKIFTAHALDLVNAFEQSGGLTSKQADEFVTQVRATFEWNSEATVNAETYHRLHKAHRLIADVVCFKGPHINHLTPRTLDIDAAQAEMPKRGMFAKEEIEGPPRRKYPILLRQTSFKALEEKVEFTLGGEESSGTHTARFGEVEQRGMALTRKGRALYDQLLGNVREATQSEQAGLKYKDRLTEIFKQFPDDLEHIRRQDLAFFRYSAVSRDNGVDTEDRNGKVKQPTDLDGLISEGFVEVEPITYEDFLPVSAAGIFQSNLGGAVAESYLANDAKAAFEAALGAPVLDEIDLYEAAQARSLQSISALFLTQGATL